MIAPVVLAFRVLLSLCLYAFLVWALYLLWRGIREQGNALATRKIPPICLTVQASEIFPQQFYFTQPEITIGRDAACECPMEDETVSARHARISFHHTQWWVEDLNSTNGTKLNGENVTTPTVITTDDEISCGNITFSISLLNDIHNE